MAALNALYATFADWINGNGGFLSDAVDFVEVNVGGRGVVCKRDLPKSFEFLRLPKHSLLLNYQTSSNFQRHNSRSLTRAESDWAPLVAAIMLERADPQSFWRPYLDILPQRVDLPCEWPIVDRAILGETYVAEMIQTDFSELEERVASILQGWEREKVRQGFHDAASLISSYSFSDAKHHVILSMVPFADFLNHRTGHNNARLFFGKDGALSMRCIRACTAGEQLYNTYGRLGNTELLLQYGYIDEPNPHTEVMVRSRIVRRVLQEHRIPKNTWLSMEELRDAGCNAEQLGRILRLELRHYPKELARGASSARHALATAYMAHYRRLLKATIRRLVD